MNNEFLSFAVYLNVCNIKKRRFLGRNYNGTKMQLGFETTNQEELFYG